MGSPQQRTERNRDELKLQYRARSTVRTKNNVRKVTDHTGEGEIGLWSRSTVVHKEPIEDMQLVRKGASGIHSTMVVPPCQLMNVDELSQVLSNSCFK
jgi:hypothetical protein